MFCGYIQKYFILLLLVYFRSKLKVQEWLGFAH